ncbi:MAG: hypothetical protein MR471_04585 [Clostridia bacterium]|nr:hypothetical protein [Clostridia bacterium]MDY3784198.1 hypothetical protein [Eubacteriales bacterium]
MTSKNNRHNNVLSMTVSAMVSALSVTVLYLGSVIEVLDLTMALVASLLITFVYTEIGDRWEWLSYAVTGLLSALLFQNKFIAAVYILFAGNYPMLKSAIERIPKKAVQWTLKLAAFNAEFTLIFVVSKYVFMIADVGYTLNILAYLFCNTVFVLYDVVLGRVIVFYKAKLRKRFAVKKR